MCNSSQEELFRVRFLYLSNNGSSIERVRYLGISPTRKSLIDSAVKNLDDDPDLKVTDISVDSVPPRRGDSFELVHIKFSDLCEKLLRG